jgi:3-methyladenine DNA glycosylase AlkD
MGKERWMSRKGKVERSMQEKEVLAMLKQCANPYVLEGMVRFGSTPAHALGISIPILRKLAREIGKDHTLALALWASGLHEARILASMLADPQRVSEQQMEAWVHDFDTWDICDQVCGNLFDKTPHAYQKAREWCHREEEYVRRAGFVMMAELAVHDKHALDEAFLPFFPLMKQYATDERNFVKKAVNWALRQIGKRNPHLRLSAMRWAEEIKMLDTKSARWIANDALKELQRQKDDAFLSLGEKGPPS